ncbi:kinase-like domain-containing protein [Neohortaea acidophila]|uniref:Kinase-like domain-containing protein n=1 Tax=Neohortaea acidophila TaxID=245834 RepID=A0A6A6PKW3_9PEZI|nr:kinase-like domain-containing protein [Neohortaea acidophila]KAF2480133.1 kinase-like domain-containing protein [Neohortaea acidophila]
MAMNANMYGFAGHSLVTPHFAIKQAWWTTERITAKVTRTFVTSKLRGEERDFLAQQVPFGEGLTDSTYMDWILDKCKRLFLILAEVGVPDQIFGCIDDAWTDDDLPIPLHSIPSLELSVEPDDALNQRFHDTQFRYLLRELQPGSHISYGPSEHIPMEHVNTAPPAVTLQVCDRVHFPGKPNEVFMRRKVNLVEKDTGKDHRESFMRDIQEAQRLQHPHIAPVWASYTSEDAAYILSNFVGEHTLGTFIDHRGPTQWKQLPPARQLPLLLEWMHCLADTVAFLHRRGVAHTAIRPSNILINRQNRIAFADVGALRTFQRGKKIDKIESYDYAASESHLASRSTHAAQISPSPAVLHPGTLRDLPSTTPFMSDIYSLACVFLDILTFILRGKTTDFVKFRTTRPTSVPGSPRSPRGKSDTSFHSDPEKILEWITMLKNESERRSEQIFRGFPDLLLLIRRMLAQNPALRPTAIEVREQLQSIFLIPSMSFSSDQGLLPGFVE